MSMGCGAVSSINVDLKQDSPLSALPEELRRQILSCLEHADLASLRQVSRAFREQAGDEELWQSLYERQVWMSSDSILLRQDEEGWKETFAKKMRIEKHGSGAAFGRELGTICFLRDGTLIRTIASGDPKPGSGEEGRPGGVKRKQPASGSDSLHVANNRSAIARALQRSLENHGRGSAVNHAVRIIKPDFYSAQAVLSEERSSSIFDRLLSVSCDLHSAIRAANVV